MAKVKVKLETICATDRTGRAPFVEALQAVRKLTLPAKTFYWLNKIGQAVEREFADYEAARRNLVITLGVKTDTGYEVPPEKSDEFIRQMAELNTELELPIEDTVKLELPATVTGADWILVLTVLEDVFAAPL